jgi:uncharacterized protein (DUF1501 family)
MMIKRRHFLEGIALYSAANIIPRIAFASGNADQQGRFIFVLLRGALDGLTAVVPYADPDYQRLRTTQSLAAPGQKDGVLKLTDLFGLHPTLKFFGESFASGELLVFHAVASPYRERSHFDGQDVLESGLIRPQASQSGWLNRALLALPTTGRVALRKELGVTLGANIPLVMRGEAGITSWSPSRQADIDEDTVERIADLYANDALLSRRLAEALAADEVARSSVTNKDAQRKSRYLETVAAAGRFLRADNGPRVAFFDISGWDTHANQGAAQGILANRLSALDSSLRLLKTELGAAWRHTTIVLATEFGRTAALNGTRGTDHGTGGVAFILGGATRGGRVITDWPGLSAQALHERRDLRPTLDLRAVLKGVLAEQLQLPQAALGSSVFPDSAAIKPLTGLVRT